MAEFVTLEIDGMIGTIRLNRSPINALNKQVQEELRAAAQEASRRDDIRAVIVYGGEEAFCAGADIKEMSAMGYADMVRNARPLSSSLSTVADIHKPTVAAITGYALGGGLELALCCDRRIISDSTRLGLPEILLGIYPGAGGTQRLPRLIGMSRAKDIIYTGRFVEAQEAIAIGLADEIVGAEDVYLAARNWAEQFSAGPAYALAAAKKAIDGGLDLGLRSGLDLESELFAPLFATDDQKIGMASFLEYGLGKAEFVGH
ncbi:enoyl-CoA hydratase/isomerase family protein [Mycobacterium simiae]|uniref:Probable enoyl-CoA hydratase EchA17 n=1 Tax=Mycobacterium simiae TaxID=1784 RepID=A0A1X0XY19_MYCSI|nr:enoyl-CoA hydratase-related protein [Mycobacterium simiae]ORJ57830.1 enoyl-CoA hydratase [Mycobacterium simiae]